MPPRQWRGEHPVIVVDERFGPYPTALTQRKVPRFAIEEEQGSRRRLL